MRRLGIATIRGTIAPTAGRQRASKVSAVWREAPADHCLARPIRNPAPQKTLGRADRAVSEWLDHFKNISNYLKSSGTEAPKTAGGAGVAMKRL